MQNDFILGNYTPYNTFIHKIDARLKLLFTIILMTAVFLSYGTYITTLIVDGILLIFIFACIFISRIKILQVIKSLKYIECNFSLKSRIARGELITSGFVTKSKIYVALI